MNFIQIRVESHSGYKADEYPICFYWKNIKFEIKEIVDRWYQSYPTPDWPVADYFKVCTVGNLEYIIKHELRSDKWFVASPDEAVIRYSSN
jgi:hypothetical protein